MTERSGGRGAEGRAWGVALLAGLLAHPATAAADAAAARAALARGDPAAAAAACAGPAEGGDADCQNVLGWLVLRRPDLGGAAAARSWFEKASAQGHRKALRNLAFLLASGLGGPADMERAAALYREAGALPAAASAPDAAPPETETRPGPPPPPAPARSLEARYRTSYADFLRLRTLHGLDAPDGAAAYVSDAEMAEARRLAARAGGAARAAGVGVEVVRGEVEEAQRVMLRLLARPRARPDAELRAGAEAALRRLRDSAGGSARPD